MTLLLVAMAILGLGGVTALAAEGRESSLAGAASASIAAVLAGYR